MIDRPDPSESKPGKLPSGAPKAARPKPRRDDIGAVTSGFIREIDSLADTLPLSMLAIGDALKTATSRLSKFISDHGRNHDTESGSFEIRTDDMLRLQSLSHRVERTTAASELVPRSFVVALVSQYDSFLGNLIQALLLLRPEVLNASERALSFTELVSFGTIEAARDHIVEKEVESVLRRSHTEQFEWLENKFKIKLREGLTVWPTFVELTERRNLFVHTGGQVSAQYLQNCRAQQIDCAKIKRGDVLTVTPSYFREAHEATFEIGVKLANVFWRKLEPDDRAVADGHLTSITYNLLVERKYALAKRLLDFATEVLKDYASTEHRLRFVVNRVQAYKWSGDSEQATKLLDREDFSALSDPFQLAEAVLRDDFPRAVELVRRIGRTGSISLGDYREWPLFRMLRKDPAFQTAINEVFGEPLNRVNVVKEAPPPAANGDATTGDVEARDDEARDGSSESELSSEEATYPDGDGSSPDVV